MEYAVCRLLPPRRVHLTSPAIIDPPVRPDTSGPVVLFDGVCNLCNGAVTWIIARDPQAVFRFASLQSAAGQRALAAHTVSSAWPDSIVLIDHDGVHVESVAALRVARRLGAPWSWLALGRFLPRSLGDAVYRLISRHRYRWFGRRDACMIPDPSLSSRFLA